jgi:Beta-ketoacyl synthase, N-terminal domain
MSLAARIAGVGLVGPGLAGWSAAREVLSGRAPYERRPTVIPAPETLPATERRRAGKGVRLTLAAGLEAVAAAGRSPREVTAVFASSGGDGEVVHAICEALASDDREISPTRFHNSVHNAPAGYWGIATGATQPADSLAAFDASFAAGLLESLARLAQDPASPVLLVAYDAPYPEPLAAARPIADAFAVALLLEGAEGAGTPITAAPSREAAQPMGDAAFEALRVSIPSARALPLLALLARRSAGRVALEYVEGLALAVEVAP